MNAPLPNLWPTISAPLSDARLRVISNGMGVQSVTMILLAQRGLIGPMPDAAIDAQTGDERSSSAENMRWLQSPNMRPDFPFVEVHGDDIAADLRLLAAGAKARMPNPPFFIRNPDGSRGVLTRGCTRDYKLRPIWRKCRQLLGYGLRSRMPGHPVVEMWVGITVDEAHRMAPSPHDWIVNRYPLIEIDWTRWHCEDWLWREFGIRLGHSGCRMCPYRTDAEWLAMQRDHPDDFAAAVEFDRLIRRGLPGVEGEAFLHDSLRPLDQVDFAAEIERKRGGLFGWAGSCDGFCGV